jgi:hypothetical protein
VTDFQLPPQLTIWGDFTSPTSALLSLRVDALRAEGLIDVDWRAVRRRWPEDEARADEELGAAFDEVVQRASPGELLALRLPRRRFDSEAATIRYAALDRWDRLAVRAKLFEAVWSSDLDISSPVVLDMLLPAPAVDDLPAAEEIVESWQGEWSQLGDGIVPAARGADGRVVRGTECLDALGALR